MILRISSLRPMTGSKAPLRASSLKSLRISFQGLIFFFGVGIGDSLISPDLHEHLENIYPL